MLRDSDHWLLSNYAKLEELAAIVFLGRSGSVFLGSLLDNHPEVIMLPGTQLAFYYHFWEKYGNLPTTTLIHTFTAYFASFFDVYAFSPLSLGTQPAIMLGFAEMGEDRNQTIEIDKNRFLEVMHTLLDSKVITRKSFFQSVHVAYTIACHRTQQLNRNKLPLIVYQLHMNWPSLVSQLIEDFPKTKMIHMIREPFQTLGSHFKHSSYNCHVMNRFYEDAFSHVNAESKAVKLEDLHTKPKETLTKIAGWLKIQWSDTLLESTFNGIKWWNLKDVEQVSGFNKVIITKKHTDFYSRLDTYRLNILFYKRFANWNYFHKKVNRVERWFVLLLLILPFKMEILHYKNDQSARYIKLKNIIVDWIHPRRRRSFLFKAWINSLNNKFLEVPLL